MVQDLHRHHAEIWPSKRRELIDWLMRGTQAERYIDRILVELCEQLIEKGVPVARSTLHFRTHHPEWLGARILWRKGSVEAKITTFDYGVEQTEQFRRSPASEIYAGSRFVRKNLRRLAEGSEEYPLYKELADEGLTDYAAWPIEHTLGKRHVLTFASDGPEGFSEDHLAFLTDLIPPMTLLSEIRIKNVVARTLLDTYVGPKASAEILAGATRRGTASTISAAIMICDLRNFTEISSHWDQESVLAILNGYFDAVTTPIEANGGEILKFMGDGLLAVFPLSEPKACTNLICAVRKGQSAMWELNRANSSKGLPHLSYGVGVHVGDVAYGNIGSNRRLDFTVIGPAVNIASRLEALTKEAGLPVLVSQAFADMVDDGCGLSYVGDFRVRGWDAPVSVSALRVCGSDG